MVERKTPLPEAGAPEALYLIDISSYIFRAYYAIGHLSTSRGEATNAVFGVTRMLQKLWTDRKPAYLAVAMDSKTPTWRKQTFAEYKANRPPPPDDLKAQFPIVQEMVEAFQIPILQQDGFEADDLIATGVRLARAAGLVTVIVTGDKDLMQLVDDRTLVYDTMKDKVFGPAEVEAKFGVRPDQLGDMLAIMGDSSDNIPGVPKVGAKTALKLLKEHDNLEAVLAAGPTTKGKLGERLVAHADDARLSRELVALRDDMDVEFDLDALRFGDPDKGKLRSLLERLEFGRLLNELGPQLAQSADEGGRSYRTITTAAELDEAMGEIRQVGALSLDLETDNIDPVRASIVGVALSWKAREGAYVPIAHSYLGMPDQLPLDQVLSALKALVEDEAIRVFGQNFKYDDIILRRHGVHVANVAFDTMMASYLLDAEKRSHGLDRIALDLLGYKMISYDEVTQKRRGSQLSFDQVEVEEATTYAGEDAEIVFTLTERLEPTVREAGFGALMDDVELPLGRILATMELTGVLVDADLLRRLSRETGVKLRALEEAAQEAAGGGRPFNVNSPRQLETVLFDDLGLPSIKKTKGRTGRSTDVEVLSELAEVHELPRIVLEHRQLAKLKGTYLDGLPKLINPKTGRIHTSYNQAVAATGRLSSSEPNLQNIPIRTDVGRQIREAFVTPPGHTLLAADYSQVELRVLAHLSEDPLLLDSFERGEDVHARTAREIFGIEGDVPREERRRAKAINFGVVYGKTEFGLAKELGISRGEAGQFIQSYFDRYAGVATYMEETIEAARRGEGVFTMAGRRRMLPDIGSRSYVARTAAERMARNTPIQGTAADIMKVAMVRLAPRLEEAGLRSRMVMTVHDELVLEVPTGEEEAVEPLVVEVMAGAAELRVPLVVDVGWGSNWAAAH